MTSLFEQLMDEANKPATEIVPVRAPSSVARKPKASIGLKHSLPSKGIEATRTKMANVQSSPEIDDMMDKADFSDIDTSNEIDDETAAYIAGATSDRPTAKLDVTPRISSMLPKVIGNAIAKVSNALSITTDPNDIEWHMVKHLPAYLAAPLRAMGRQIFEPFTSTPIENIQVLANVNGQGPNPMKEIDAISKYVTSQGESNQKAELHFSKVFPGYHADVAAYDAQGFTFLFVKDFAGSYIYSWPSSESKQLPASDSKKLGLDMKKLSQGNDQSSQ